jgi:drug/metabolite transporter (DMT)-like permease
MKIKSFIYIIAACALWGSSCLFVNAMAPYGLSTLQMMGARSAVAFIAIALYSLIFNRSTFKTSSKSLLLFALVGLFIYATGALYYASMVMTSVSTAVVLMYTAPIYVVIFSVIFLKERLTKLKLISIIIMLVGCTFVSGIIGGLRFDAIGILLGILSGLAYAGYNIVTKISMQKGYAPTTCTLYGFMFMTFVALTFCEPQKTATIITQDPLPIISLFVALGLITSIIPYFLYTLALREIPAGTAASLGILEPMSATLFSIVFLGEKLTVLSIIGMLLILFAVFMLGKAEGKGEVK